MKGENVNDFYCSAKRLVKGRDNASVYCLGRCAKSKCENYHRKWPTPEQYKEEYGEAYPNEGAVFFRRYNDTHWAVGVWDTVRKFNPIDYITVCACTPFGKPDKGWRP